MLQEIPISARNQARIYASGLCTLITLGTLALLALLFLAFWLVIQFVSLLLTSAIEALTTIGLLYTSADPLIKFLILTTIGACVYGVLRAWRK